MYSHGSSSPPPAPAPRSGAMYTKGKLSTENVNPQNGRMYGRQAPVKSVAQQKADQLKKDEQLKPQAGILVGGTPVKAEKASLSDLLSGSTANTVALPPRIQPEVPVSADAAPIFNGRQEGLVSPMSVTGLPGPSASQNTNAPQAIASPIKTSSKMVS